jgi:hypothetical protein
MEQYKYFVQDLVILLKEKLEQAKRDQIISRNEFNLGVSMGVYECIDLIKQQASIFEIPLDEIGLDGYLLENYL